MAERDLSAGMLAAIAEGVVSAAMLIEIEYESGGQQFLRIWTGVGALSWDGKTWSGGGKVLEVSPMPESRELKAIGFSVKVSGMLSQDISIALQSLRKGRSGKVWLALFDGAGAIISDPYLAKRGRFSIAPIRDEGSTCTIEARYEDRLSDLSKPKERRYTHEDQQTTNPGDTGFRHVPGLQDRDFVWGR